MKTNSILAAALLMAAAVVSASAQTVYSVNAVGFVNVNPLSIGVPPFHNIALILTGSVPTVVNQ